MILEKKNEFLKCKLCDKQKVRNMNSISNISIETIKKELPNFKVIDISIINNLRTLEPLITSIKPGVLLVVYRTDKNKDLWKIADDLKEKMNGKLQMKNSLLYETMWIIKDGSRFSVIPELNETEKAILRDLKIWANQSIEELTDCIVCFETIKPSVDEGPDCQVCFKRLCYSCACKIVQIKNACPNCRTPYDIGYDD